MADLGNLWFSLGLDDTKFEKEWNKALKKYKKDSTISLDVGLNANARKKLEQTLKMLKEVSDGKKHKIDIQVTERTLKSISELNRLANFTDFSNLQQLARDIRTVANSSNALEQATRNTVNNANRITGEFKSQSLWMQNLNTLISNYTSLFAASRFVTNLAKVSGEFELQKRTLQAMVGEFEGSQLYNQIKDLSIVSPFQFKDLASYTKQLAAFSIPYNELYDTTKKLADVSAGLGVDMSRIILAYGQIKSAGVLRGTELRQLTEAGVPILEELAERFEQLEGKAVSVGDVFTKISHKMVSFEMVKDVFTELTSEGGKFYNMQELQADTLAGKISNLKDAYDVFLSEAGEAFDDILKGGVDAIKKLIENADKLGFALIGVGAAFGSFRLGKFIIELGKATKKAGGLGKALDSIFTKANVINLTAAAFVGLVSAVRAAALYAERFDRVWQKILNTDISKLKQERTELKKLNEALEKSNRGSQERRELISKFNSKYGEYLNAMLTEKSTAEEIAAAYERVNTALEGKYKKQAYERGMDEVEDTYGSRISTILGGIRGDLVDEDTLVEIAQFVRQELEKNINLTNKELEKLGIARFGETFKRAFTENIIQPDFSKDVSNYNEVINRLRKVLTEYQEKQREVEREVEARFGNVAYQYKEEAEFVKGVNEEYEKQIAELEKIEGLTEAQYDEKKLAADKDRLNKLIKYYSETLVKTSEDGTKIPLLPDMIKEYQRKLNALDPVLAEWAKKVNKVIKQQGIVGFNVDGKQLPGYLKFIQDAYDDLRKEQDTLNKTISKEGSVVGSKKDLEFIEKKLNWIESIAKVLDYDLTNKDDKSQYREDVKALDAEFKSKKKQLDKYRELISSGVREDVAKSVIETSFKVALPKDQDVEEYYISEFEKIADKAIVYGEEIGGNLYNSIYNAIGSNETKNFESIFKIVKKVKEELEKWGLKDFQVGGLGISKILEDYFTASKKAIATQKKLQEQLAKAEMGDAKSVAELKKQFGENWFEEAKKQINELTLLEIKNNKEIARDKIKSYADALANKAVKDTLGEGFMQSLGNKSNAELQNAISALNNVNPAELIASGMTEEELETLKKNLDAIGSSYGEFVKMFEKGIRADKISLLNEKFRKTRENVQALGGALSSVLGSFSELASSNGKIDLSELLNNLKDGVDLAFQIASAFEKTAVAEQEGSDVSKITQINWANIYAAAAQVVSKVIEAVIAQQQYNREMERSSKVFNEAVTTASFETMVLGEKLQTIFGDDVINAIEKDFQAIDLLESKLKSLMMEVMNTSITVRKGFLGIGSSTSSLRDFAPALFNATGNASYQLLEEFMDQYGEKLSDEQKAIIETIIENYKLLEDAASDIDDHLKDIFSDTASTIADRMIEAFAATGDAATQLGDLVHTIGKNMAKDLIQSLLIDQYLSPAINRIKGLYNPDDKQYEENALARTQKAILAVRDAMTAAQEAVPEVNKILESLQSYGIDFSEGVENASNVLAGLTEDQQNLLMGYINGIRADVSFNKGMVTNIMNSVGTINNNIASALIVWKQIEANTHRSADGVDKIIEYFEGIVGPYDGGEGQAFRVNIA